ncbi:hypothetical protein ACTJJ4_03065 [Microbacterium sp. 22195]|uniref:hypothetical protein n=1 Tax=Microbacterium sp. 22195 TaxID=3453891 RepID=UPI003F851936
MRIDVFKSPEMMATILAIRSLDKTLQKQIRVHSKELATPEFKKELSERANTRLEHAVIVNTATVSVSNQNMRLQSAAKGRALSGGLNPKTDYAAVEFGRERKPITYDRRNPKKGGTHKVTRTPTQIKRPNRNGYVFYPAVRKFIPRAASLYIQTTVKTIAEALKGVQE